MIDLHAHILPGVDDGAYDVREALSMARMAVESGVTAMVARKIGMRFGHLQSGKSVKSSDSI